MFDHLHVNQMLTATQIVAKTIVGASDKRLKDVEVCEVCWRDVAPRSYPTAHTAYTPPTNTHTLSLSLSHHRDRLATDT